MQSWRIEGSAVVLTGQVDAWQRLCAQIDLASDAHPADERAPAPSAQGTGSCNSKDQGQQFIRERLARRAAGQPGEVANVGAFRFALRWPDAATFVTMFAGHSMLTGRRATCVQTAVCATGGMGGRWAGRTRMAA